MILAKDPGKVFIHGLVSRPIRRHKISKNQDIPEAKDFEGDTSQFTMAMINNKTANGIIWKHGVRPGHD